MDASPHVLSLPSRRFQPEVFGLGAWTDNLAFACDLIATLQPQLLVELGTDRGESFFGFCQAVAAHSTGTRCFAVDTWRGDLQTGEYDETTFAEVSAHLTARFANFATLLRLPFDEALAQFASESIDLLHIDGLHTEAAVRHDVQSWLPKVRPGGIVLLHDISVRTRDFGVWKVWEELRATGRSYAFAEGPGLGVWQKPRAIPLPPPLEALLTAPNETAIELAEYYRQRARELQQAIARQWQDGSIRQTAAARQTMVQVFHTHDGTHREDDSVHARIGHETWKDLSLPLPAGAGAAPLRIDFLSAFTTIDIAQLSLKCAGQTLFHAEGWPAWDAIRVAGDAVCSEHPSYLRVEVTGIDPQLYLPPVPIAAGTSQATLHLLLRVCTAQSPPD
ncbi:MAG: class I SAM-dependent methyltransferase [Chthoniobacterales bacterium]